LDPRRRFIAEDLARDPFRRSAAMPLTMCQQRNNQDDGLDAQFAGPAQNQVTIRDLAERLDYCDIERREISFQQLRGRGIPIYPRHRAQMTRICEQGAHHRRWCTQVVRPNVHWRAECCAEWDEMALINARRRQPYLPQSW